MLRFLAFGGNRRVFVRDDHLFVIGKYVVIDRWFVSLITGRGSIIIGSCTNRLSTTVRTTGSDDEWTIDDNGRMYLNGIPTDVHSGQRNDTPRETEVFQTPPPTPRQLHVEEEDDGVIHLHRILPWTRHTRILRIFFLVGNQDPHMTLIKKSYRGVPITTVALRWIISKITSTLETNLPILPKK